MRKYRLVCLNGENGHMEVVRQFEAVNDGVAAQRADQWRSGRIAELWRTYRIVMRWLG
jgi:hypothetical protein